MMTKLEIKTSPEGFTEECSKQARLARDAEQDERDVMELIEHTGDLEGWK